MTPYYSDDSVTIYHGDCFELIDCLVADVVVSDPPYGMKYVHGGRKGGKLLGFDGVSVIGDEEPFDPSPWLRWPAVLWGANHFADKLPVSAGWLVWDKRDGKTTNDQSDCELAWTSFLTTARLFTRYWNGGGIGELRLHPTQKSLALMKWCLGYCPEGTVLDPFMGSGTTLRAAKDCGRKSIGIELEEAYCEVAARRMCQEVLAI